MSFKIKGSAEVSGKFKLNAESINRALTVDANGELTSSAVTATELSQLSGVTSPIQTQLNNTSTGLTDHINDASDAHDASAISNVPAGNLAATDVQAALNELQSDIDTRALDADVIKKDGSVAFTADQSMGGNQLTNLGAPSASSDAATKSYVDSVAEGLKPKQAARVATTANITLSGPQTIDGISAIAGDRVLVKDQTTASQNGIYVVAAGAWSRSLDFDSLTPIDEVNGAMVAVQEGTSNAGKVFVQSGVVATIGTDPINFIFFNSSASLVGGDGIAVSGNNISVDHDGEGLAFVANQLALELDGSTLTKSASGLKLSDTAVTPATLGSASETVTITVDQQGRLTAASEQAISITASQVSDFNSAAQTATISQVITNGVTTKAPSEDAVFDALAGKASTTLNNLGTTSINADLLPDNTGNNRNLGSSSQIWNVVRVQQSFAYIYNLRDTATGNNNTTVMRGDGATTPGGNSVGSYIAHNGPTNFSIFTNNNGLADANPSRSLFFETGDKTAGTGNSGAITLRTGTSSGGTRGEVSIISRQINVNSQKIVNLTDPTAAQDAATKNYVDSVSGASAGDIAETSFALANNQTTPANVTGFAFANATVRSFEALVSVEIDATADLFEVFTLRGIQKGASWDMSVTANGDDSQVVFSITNAGQVQYSSGNIAGFSSGLIKFRAITLTV